MYCILYRYSILYRSNLMDAISYTAARTNLAKTMEQVCEDHFNACIMLDLRGAGRLVAQRPGTDLMVFL